MRELHWGATPVSSRTFAPAAIPEPATTATLEMAVAGRAAAVRADGGVGGGGVSGGGEGGGGRVAPQLHSSMLHRRLTARSTRVCGFSARSTRDTVVLPQAARQVGVPGRVGETAHVHRLSQHRAIVTAMLLLSPPQCEHPHLPLLL